MLHVGQYTSLSGCVYGFLTTPSTELAFSPQVRIHCKVCEIVHGFGLAHSYSGSDRSKLQKIYVWCQNNGYDTDVSI